MSERPAVEYRFKGWRVVQTCERTPEQYDVFSPDGEKVGFVHLRWGSFEVSPRPLAEDWFSTFYVPGDQFKPGPFPESGEFVSEEDRLMWLEMAVAVVAWHTERGIGP